MHPAYPTLYTIVIAQLDDLPRVRMAGSMPGAPNLVEDQPMEVCFQDMGQGDLLPQWKPAES